MVKNFQYSLICLGDAVTITSVGDVDDGSNDDILTTCKIADNVRSALHILDKMPADDNFVTDEGKKFFGQVFPC